VILGQGGARGGNRRGVAFAETGTLPWLARKHGPFEVAITVRSQAAAAGCFPWSVDSALDVHRERFPAESSLLEMRCPAR